MWEKRARKSNKSHTRRFITHSASLGHNPMSCGFALLDRDMSSLSLLTFVQFFLRARNFCYSPHALLQRISNVPFKIFSPVNFLLLHSHERKQQRALVNVCLAMKKLFSDSFDAHFFAAQLLSPLCCFPGVCAIESLMCQNKIEKFPFLSCALLVIFSSLIASASPPQATLKLMLKLIQRELSL